MRLTIRHTLFIAALTAAFPLSALAGVSETPSPAQPSAPSSVLPGPVHLLDKGDKDKNDKPKKSEVKSEDEQRQDAMAVIAEAADRVVSPEGLTSVLDLIAARDRDRIDDGVKKADLKPLAQSAKEFGEIWRKKFGSGFDATKNLKQLNGTRVELRDGDGDKQYAFIYFPAFGGWKEFEMHLIRNSKTADWRIELPNELSASKLVKESSHDVQKLVDDKDRWFSDEHINYNSAVTQLVHAMAFPSSGEHSSDMKKK